MGNTQRLPIERAGRAQFIRYPLWLCDRRGYPLFSALQKWNPGVTDVVLLIVLIFTILSLKEIRKG